MKKKTEGFTLVEMIVTLGIIVTLSLLSFPIYKGVTHKNSKLAEGYVLLGTIVDSQVAYFNEYGSFYPGIKNTNGLYTLRTSNDPVLGINAINNRYFTCFSYLIRSNQGEFFKYSFTGAVFSTTAGTISIAYNLTERFEPQVTGI